ncbi:colicin E5-related ribonuclease [Puniceibacterium sediminis]|uniref:Filamentous hemagglutinin family N-terminal domain-containing protein n=1 Tax=Puniceibacterium sediminis TaxID=1608407 RepID=A0A238WEJ9_9RHOB|nr:colicin E5-related ribonuclease [Puniceibacterium sediminis]SNR44703.1 filamentous hemagglutinin family N-terminal domain-containing protein [Puniceibacterium sediminis]
MRNTQAGKLTVRSNGRVKKMRKLFDGFVAILSCASIVLTSVAASAQTVIVDPSAPGTSFLQTGNGTPQVNIATPDQGVSINKYDSFNVDDRGLILNNSTSNGVSVIGQNVTANPNLMVSGPANTIVNEVTGATPSTMTGTTEVFGKKAKVIMANPNGITCNGCSFLNTHSSILTTGQPSQVAGRVDLTVTKGTITVGPEGYDPGQNGALIGRHVVIDGAVSTQTGGNNNNLLVSGGAQRVTGANWAQLDKAGIVAAPSTVAKTTPFAIDASQRGRLSAENVIVRNVEATQGVNLYGVISGLTLDAKSGGTLFYRDVVVSESATLTGSEIRQYGDLSAGGAVTLNGRAFTLYDGRVIETDGNVEITASDYVVIAGEVTGTHIGIDVTAGKLTNSGFLMADGVLDIVAGESVAQQRQIASEYDTTVDPALQQYLDAYYAQLASGGEEADIAAGMIARAGQHQLVEEHADKGATSTGHTVTITSETGDILNEGGAIAATRDVSLSAGNDILNRALALQTRMGAEDGCVSAACDLKTEFHAAEILAGGDVTLTAINDVRNTGSDLAAAGSIRIDAGQDVVLATENSSTLVAGLKLSEFQAFANWQNHTPSRLVTLHGDIEIGAGRDLTVEGARIAAGRDLTLEANGAMTLASAVSGNSGGYIVDHMTGGQCAPGNYTCYDSNFDWDWWEYSHDVATVAASMDEQQLSSPTILSGRAIRVTAGQDIEMSSASLLSEQDLSVQSLGGKIRLAKASESGGSATAQDPEHAGNLSLYLHGDATSEEGGDLRRDYLEFLQGSELLTAVEALRRAESGADIRQAGRSVAVQSYNSLSDSEGLDQSSEDEVHARAADWATHASGFAANLAQMRDLHDTVSMQLQALEDRLATPSAERQLELDRDLALAGAEHDATVSVVEQAYAAALAANAEEFSAPALNYDEWFLSHYPDEYWDDYSYFDDPWFPQEYQRYAAQSSQMKAQADAQAVADRDAALLAAATWLQLEEAQIRATSSDEGILAEIADLSGQLNNRHGELEAEQTALTEQLNSDIDEALRSEDALLLAQAERAGLRRLAVAQGSVQKGAPSLAAALTDSAFPELALAELIGVNATGIVESQRVTQEERTRTVTETREIGEYQDVETTTQVQVVASAEVQSEWDYCNNVDWDSICAQEWNSGYFDPISHPIYQTVTSTETQWVVTGTEEYEVEETYLADVAVGTPVLSVDIEEQNDFLDATSWHFASRATDTSEETLPATRLFANGDALSLTSITGIMLADASLGSAGSLSLGTLGTLGLSGSNISGGTVQLTALGDVIGRGTTLQSDGDLTLGSLGSIDLGSTARAYDRNTGYDNVIGTLSDQTWGSNHFLISQELSSLAAGGDLAISATDNLVLGGVIGNVGGDAALTSGADLAFIAPRSEVAYSTGNSRNGTDTLDLQPHVTDLTIAGDFQALAGDNLILEGAMIEAGGMLDLAAENDLMLSAAQEVYQYNSRSYSRNWFRTKRSSRSILHVTHDGTDLSSGEEMNIESELGDVITAGSTLISEAGDINMSATEGDILVGAFTDINRDQRRSSRSYLFGLISSSNSSFREYATSTGSALLAGLDLNVVSGGNTELVGAQLSAGRDLNFDVGGDLHVRAAIDSTREESFSSNVGLVLSTTETERSNRETAVLTTLDAGGDITFSIGGRPYVTLYNSPYGDSPSVAELYPDELAALAGLVLLDQELLDEYFHEETKALSPAFIMVVTIALTQGFGALLANMGVAGLTTTAANGVVSLTHAGNAVASMAASTTVGIANGTISGDLDLGEILRSAAISAGTSYLTRSINLAAMGDEQAAALAELQGNTALAAVDDLGTRTLTGLAWGADLTTSVFGNNLTVAGLMEGALDASISAGVQSAANGTNFGEVFQSSFLSSVVSLGLADAQSGIGDIFERGQNGGEGSLGHVMLHGLAGCVAAEAQGANCAVGAAGGIAGAVFSGMQQAPDREAFANDADYQFAYADWRNTVLKQAELVTLAAGYLFSGGDPNTLSVATSIGTSVVANNYLTHAQFEALENEYAACENAECVAEVWNRYGEISAEQQHQLGMCGTDISCMAPHLQAIADARSHPLRAALMASNSFQRTAVGAYEYQAEVAYFGHTDPGLLGLDFFGELFTPNYDEFYLAYPEWADSNCNGLSGASCMTNFQGYANQQAFLQGLDVGATAFTISLGAGITLAVATEAALALRVCAANPTCWNTLSVTSGELALGFSGATAGQTFYTVGAAGALAGRLLLQHGDLVLGVIDDLGRVLRPVSQTADDAGRFLVHDAVGNIGYLDDTQRFTVTVVAPNGLATNVPTSGRKFNQLTSRGWDQSSIDNVVNNPVHTSTATNRATENSATAYFDRGGNYIVRDDVTGDLVQMSNRNDPNWIPDSTITDPYIPG